MACRISATTPSKIFDYKGKVSVHLLNTLTNTLKEQQKLLQQQDHLQKQQLAASLYYHPSAKQSHHDEEPRKPKSKEKTHEKLIHERRTEQSSAAECTSSFETCGAKSVYRAPEKKIEKTYSKKRALSPEKNEQNQMSLFAFSKKRK